MPTSQTSGSSSEAAFPNIYEIFEDVPFSVAVLRGPNLVIEYINRVNLAIWRCSRESVIGKPLYEAMPNLRRDTEPIHKQVYATGKRFQANDVPIEIMDKDGVHLHYFQVSIDPIHDKERNIIGQIATSIDITEQVLTRKSLLEANERASLAIESGGLGTVEVNLQTKEVSLSARMQDIFEQELSAPPVAYLNSLHPDDRPIRDKAYEKALVDGSLEYEARVLRKDGTVRWIKAKGRVYFDNSNQPLRLVAVVQDISDQKIFAKELERQVVERTEDLQRAHQLLLSSNDYLQRIINVFSAPLQVLQPVVENGNVVDFVYKLTNTAYAGYTTFTPEALVGKKVSAVFPGYFETDSFRNIRQTATTGIANTWENHYAADGLDIFNLMSAAMMNNEVVVHMTDFTKLKALQLELQRKVVELERSNKSLEEFAHAASHDLKEPIRKIQFFTDQLNDELSTQVNERQLRLFQRIENAALRMASLIDDLLLYSHISQRPRETALVNLNETVRLVQGDLELVIAQQHAQLHVGDLPTVNGHKRQLQQLFQNLVSNAIKYSKAGIAPVITIQSTLVSGATANLENDTMYHCISVEDNGIGFEQEHGEQIFQMFQRLHAKEAYSGTGVGLSIVRSIVENHNGKIVAMGVPDEGATFYIYLPVV